MTSDELRTEHIRRFLALPPAQRMQWALNTGWAVYRALPPEKKRIYRALRDERSRAMRELGRGLAGLDAERD